MKRLLTTGGRIFFCRLNSILFVVAITCPNAIAQNPDLKRTWHWYFGHYAGLDFSSGTAVPDTNGKMSVLERCAVISDTSGNLLFYTDGHQVWNRNHQIMQNGDSLGLYFPTPRDASVIIPKPDSDSIYYIFNVDGWENQFQRGIRWHEVDMSLDNGLGAVTSKNNLLYAPVTEQLAATRHANGCDYWVVTHERSSDKFLAFKVTSDGVDNVPGISAAGQDFSIPQQHYNLNGGFNLVFSPSGEWAAQIIGWGLPITGIPYQGQLIRFNSNTGIFYGAFDLPVVKWIQSVSFSPDNTKLYFETEYLTRSGLFQLDLKSDVDSIIQQSKTFIYSSYYAIAQDGQIGSDGILYLAVESPNPYFLSTIEYPNLSGSICNVQYGILPLSRRATQGLPNFVSNFLVDVAPAPCQYTFVSEDNRDVLKNILVYPNPADDRINITTNNFQTSYTTIRIIDITSRVWLEKIMKQEKMEFALDVSQIPNGFYLLELHTAKNFKVFRIFIHHQNPTP